MSEPAESDAVVLPDDLGYPVRLRRPIRRIVSLVPSLTESIAVSRPGTLVAATDWCTHPAGLDVTRIRGTKNPDRAAIISLRPDLVIANREENRRTDIEQLRAAGIEVWVTDIETVDGALSSLRRLIVDALGWPAPTWLDAADRVWSPSAPPDRHSAVIVVWRDPWMVVGRDTFTGDLARRVGLLNLYDDSPQRYPRVELEELIARRPQVVLLPDEPYRFTASDGPEAFPGLRCGLVSGRQLTWYGPSLVQARRALEGQLKESF
ncbi:MAG: cobalamin-binding protein [Pseudonocardiales bacterium]|nr:cobalamin-binding protein [Pseudonocardiales bacterium]